MEEQLREEVPAAVEGSLAALAAAQLRGEAPAAIRRAFQVEVQAQMGEQRWHRQAVVAREVALQAAALPAGRRAQAAGAPVHRRCRLDQ